MMTTTTKQAALGFGVAPERHQDIRQTRYVQCPKCEAQIPDRVRRCGWCGHERRRT
jgi:hypothetical protein